MQIVEARLPPVILDRSVHDNKTAGSNGVQAGIPKYQSPAYEALGSMTSRSPARVPVRSKVPLGNSRAAIDFQFSLVTRKGGSE